MTITGVLIAITVLISFLAFNRDSLLAGMMMNPWLIHHRQQYYRFLTSGFIHGSYMHLFLNMFSFYFFGSAMESVFKSLFGSAGSLYFIILYLVGIIVSDIPTYFKNINNPGYNSLGASGGVASVIFAFILFMPTQSICLYVALCLPGFIFGILYLGYSYYQGRRSQDHINHEAHLYGSLFGLVFCIVIYPRCIPDFFTQITYWLHSL